METAKALSRIEGTPDRYDSCEFRNIFLVDEPVLDAVLAMQEFCNRQVVVIDSKEKADHYTLETIVRDITRPHVQDGNFYVLETRGMPKPVNFSYYFVVGRFYFSRHDTNSRVLVLKDHYRPDDPSRFFQGYDKLCGITLDLSISRDLFSWEESER